MLLYMYKFGHALGLMYFFAAITTQRFVNCKKIIVANASDANEMKFGLLNI